MAGRPVAASSDTDIANATENLRDAANRIDIANLVLSPDREDKVWREFIDAFYAESFS